MAFMKKQVNLFLILVILVSVLLIAGMTVFYQERLSTLGTDYLETSDDLQMCNATLESTLAELQQTEQRLQQNIVDVDKTVGLFEEQQAEVAEREERISQLQSDIDGLLSTIEDNQEEITSLESTIREKNSQIATLQNRINDLNEVIDELEEDLDACQAST